MTAPRCPACGGVYAVVDGCRPDVLPSVPVWGSEPWWTDPGFDGYIGDELEPAERCTDCGASLGHHHHPGCCRSWCEACQDQHLGCACYSGVEQ